MLIKTLSQIIISVLSNPSTLEESKTKPEYFTRVRKMTFVDLCQFLIWHRKRSTQTAIALFTFFNEPFKKFELMSEQAISKARSHINEIPFIKCFKALRDYEYSSERRNTLKTYFKMFLIAIDGSTTALPNTELPKKEFGELKGAPTARIALGFDVLNNRILGADIDKIKTGEREQAKKIIKEILTTLSGNLCCFIFNRGYPCEWLIRLLLDNQVHFVMRVRNKFSLAVDKAPLGSTIVELYPDVKIRVFKFKLQSGTVETLLTDLYDLPSFALKKIYRNRWGVETEYDKLKNKLELGNYTGWTRNCILQNFWINILLAYFSGVISQTATCQIQTKRLGKANQYLYKANMTRVVTSVFEFFTSLVFSHSKKKKMKVLKRILLLSELQPVPIRPDRNIPRNRFKRIAKFHHNRKAA